MRSEREIVERCRATLKDSFLPFGLDVLLPRLPFEVAREFLKPETPGDDWPRLANDRAALVAEMRDYMAFAWEKAMDERGISASRSVMKMREWLWLLGDDETLAFAEDEANYAMYGRPILRRICEAYGFETRDH